MSASHFLDSQGPPRKKMRKGTKSCTECRRRKIRCTYDTDRPNICNECHSRGFTCVDQEYGTLDTKVTGVLSGEQSYSLRERVTQLENVVRDLLLRVDHTSPSSASASPAQQQYRNEILPVHTRSVEETSIAIECKTTVDEPVIDGHQIENAPVLQILNNNVISRTEGTATRGQDAAAIKERSPKAVAAREELLKLIPPRGDIIRIRDKATHWWSAWIHMFPEILERNRSCLTGHDSVFDIPKSPGEVAKFLICHLMCIEQLPLDFDFAALEMPIDRNQYTECCVATIDRLIVYDDDLSGTLPGLEAIGLLSKWYMNLGRPRKSWLSIRRAIEIAQLAGLHISTARDPHPNDTLYDRRLKLWTMLGLVDRFLCLILGLPSAIQDNLWYPQVERRLKRSPPNMETYSLRLSTVIGRIIDRNQGDPAKMSVTETLEMDQELESQAQAMPDHFWKPEIPDREMPLDESMERLMLPFTYYYLRATLHLPFMLRSHTDRRYRYNREVALESARKTLVSYNKLRIWDRMNPFICRVIDFQAFSVTMLLIINLVGYSDEDPNYSEDQLESDWALVDATTEVLRHAASEQAGTVAAQSLHIIEGLSKNVVKSETEEPVSCKISVPYFGVITVTPGKKKPKTRAERQADRPTPSNNSIISSSSSSLSYVPTPPNQPYNNINNITHSGSLSNADPSWKVYAPPQTNIDFSTMSTTPGKPSLSSSQQPSSNMVFTYPDDSRVQLENILTLPSVGMVDPTNPFTDFTATNNEDSGLWANMNLDLDLDQGWNLDWLGIGSTMM